MTCFILIASAMLNVCGDISFESLDDRCVIETHTKDGSWQRTIVAKSCTEVNQKIEKAGK
jgi:hypothetical protein